MIEQNYAFNDNCTHILKSILKLFRPSLLSVTLTMHVTCKPRKSLLALGSKFNKCCLLWSKVNWKTKTLLKARNHQSLAQPTLAHVLCM